MTSRGLRLSAAERTFVRALETQAARFGSKTLVRWEGGSRTYPEMLEHVRRFAGALSEAGVERGDRVLTFCGNRIEVLDCSLACGWLGAIFVPVNVAQRGAQLQQVLENAEPKVAVVDSALLDHVAPLRAGLPSLEHVWVTGSSADEERGAGLLPIPPGREPAAPAAVLPGDPAAILYTSGTTGLSKGVVCPQAQFYWWGELVGRDLRVTDRDILYTVLPMFHVNALSAFWQALLAGATYVFGARFSASRFWEEIVTSRATVTYLLGAMVQILLKREPAPVERDHRLRIVHGPGTSAAAVERFESRCSVPVIDGYGSTETNHVFSNVDPYMPGTMGRPLPEFDVRIVDADDNELPTGTPGELVIRPREPFSTALGYFRMAEATVESWRNLWFHTGDVVVSDADGCWRFVDRMKDSIRRRGENISSAEVEAALESHPDVAVAAVVPVPDELEDEEVMAFVVLRPGAHASPEALARHCEPRLAYFAIPRYFEFVARLPLTTNGKVKKAVLRARGVGPETWDRARR